MFAVTDGRSLIEVIDVAGKKVIDTINLSSPGQSVKLFGLAVNPQADQLLVNVICIDRGRDSVRAEEPQIWAVDRTTHRVTKLLQSNKWIAGIGWLSDNIIYSSLGGGLWELALTQPDRAQRLPTRVRV